MQANILSTVILIVLSKKIKVKNLINFIENKIKIEQNLLDFYKRLNILCKFILSHNNSQPVNIKLWAKFV